MRRLGIVLLLLAACGGDDTPAGVDEICDRFYDEVMTPFVDGEIEKAYAAAADFGPPPVGSEPPDDMIEAMADMTVAGMTGDGGDFFVAVDDMADACEDY